MENWHRKYRQEGSYFPKRRDDSEKKIDLEELEAYVKKNQDMTLKKAAQEFGVSIFTIGYWLKNSYKKKTFRTWKQEKKSEVSIKNRSKI
ncbi:IS630 transposase-related protein [Holospora elegans]|uniref:IS630 transposase-related protein n=1 Tax=Holospora elegans TaxID=431043 RepID=UPI000A040A85|nr:IS630 transposase-related protein [Holospora elegans]